MKFPAYPVLLLQIFNTAMTSFIKERNVLYGFAIDSNEAKGEARLNKMFNEFPRDSIRLRRTAADAFGLTNADFKRMYRKFSEIITGSTMVANNVMRTFPNMATSEMYIQLIGYAVDSEQKSIWEQIEDRVQTQTARSLGSYNYSLAKGAFSDFENETKELSSPNYRKIALKILNKKHLMLPQNFPDIGYSEKLATLLPAWTMYAMGSLLGLAKGGYLTNKCQISDELAILREDAVQAGRSLLLKRYKGLKPLSIRRYEFAEFEDSFTGNKSTSISLKKSYCKSCDRVKNATLASLQSKLVKLMNKYFTNEFCFPGCSCPSIIQMSEISFDYTSKCFGTLKKRKEKEECSLPCDKWGYGYTWCTKRSFGVEPTPAGFPKIGFLYTWDRCSRGDIKDCIP